MVATKVQDAGEIVRWIEEGRTFQWMADEYLRKYDLQVHQSMFSNWRRRHGMPLRNVRDDGLIPWEIRSAHRYDWPALMLRAEGRRRALGDDGITALSLKDVRRFTSKLARDGVVVHYDPLSEEGWSRVAPRPLIDHDIIREPDRATTKRRSS